MQKTLKSILIIQENDDMLLQTAKWSVIEAEMVILSKTIEGITPPDINDRTYLFGSFSFGSKGIESEEEGETL